MARRTGFHNRRLRTILVTGAVAAGLTVSAGASVSFASDPAADPKPSQSPANQDSGKKGESSSIGLKVGDKSPAATMTDADGKDVKLEDLVSKGPVVVVFYRGGWCPFCNKHLSAWQEKAGEVKTLGATLVAISPEKPEAAKETSGKDKLEFMVVSDVKQEAMKGFKLVFALNESTKTKYKGYGVDLEKRNASKTWDLPHPGTFVIDKAGVIRYASVDTDYTKRPDPEEAMKALRELAAAKNK